jgi:hypothetical protein
MLKTTKSINIRKIKPYIEEVVEEKLLELLGDPDSRLYLKTSVKKRLLNSIKKKSKGTSAKNAADELGLKW